MSFERTRPAMRTMIAGACVLLLVASIVPSVGATYAYGEEQPASAQQEKREPTTQGDDQGVEGVASETTENPVDVSITESSITTEAVSSVAEVVQKDLVIAADSTTWRYIPIRSVVDDKGNPVDRETGDFDPSTVHTNGSGILVDSRMVVTVESGEISNSETNQNVVRVMAPKDSRGYSPSYANAVLSDTNDDGYFDKAAISYVYPELASVKVVDDQGKPLTVCVRLGDGSEGIPSPYLSHYWAYNGILTTSIDKNGCFPQGCYLDGDKLVITVDRSAPLNSQQIEGVQLDIDYAYPDGVLNEVYAFSGVYEGFAPTGSGDLPVAGDAGIRVSGSLNGINVPLGAEASVDAIQLTSGASYEELTNRAGNGVLAGIFEVNLIVDGQQVHDGFGSLTVTFPVDAKYNGYWVAVWHRHNDGSITSERVVAKDGTVSVTVTDLSTFALEIGELEETATTPVSLDTTSSSDPSTLAKTDDTTPVLAFGGFALAALGAVAFAGYRTRKPAHK